MVKTYNNFRTKKGIKKILTESNIFRMILNEDGTAEIARAKGGL